MKKINVSDQIVRRAIYEIYESKCFYSGVPFDYSNMELDHIIPASYRDKPSELERLLKECNFDENFELDSLYNLVPTSKYENNRKSDEQLSIKTLMYFHNLVAKKVFKIEERIEQLKNKSKFEKHLAMLKSHHDKEETGREREKLLENIVSFISNEHEEFKEQHELYEKDQEIIFKIYTNRIGLEAVMPKYDNPTTSCILHFRTLKARDCILVLENKTVLSQLFTGLFTDPQYGTRDFIINDDNEEDSIDLDKAVIHIGNSRLKLSTDDIYKLCDVIVSYARKYIEFIKTIEDTLKTHCLPLSKRRNNYKIISISHQDWRRLILFANKHDVDKGKSDWHIFDRNNNYLKIFTNREHSKYNLGYHAFFNAEYSEDKILYSELTSDDVCITFEFVKDLDNRGVESVNERANWNAEIACNWLIKEFIPKVLGKRILGNFLRKKRNRLKDFIRSNGYEVMCYLENKKVSNEKELCNLIEILQRFHNSHPHNSYRLKKSNIVGIYNAINKCLSKSYNVNLYYICNKLQFNQFETTSQITDSINKLIENMDDITLRGFGIDLLLRGLLAALDSCYKNLSIDDIQYIRDELDYFIGVHDREVLIEKYAIDFV